MRSIKKPKQLFRKPKRIQVSTCKSLSIRTIFYGRRNTKSRLKNMRRKWRMFKITTRDNSRRRPCSSMPRAMS